MLDCIDHWPEAEPHSGPKRVTFLDIIRDRWGKPVIEAYECASHRVGQQVLVSERSEDYHLIGHCTPVGRGGDEAAARR